jgi:hypothetical protein
MFEFDSIGIGLPWYHNLIDIYPDYFQGCKAQKTTLVGEHFAIHLKICRPHWLSLEVAVRLVSWGQVESDFLISPKDFSDDGWREVFNWQH